MRVMLDIPLSAKEIAMATGGNLTNLEDDRFFNAVSTDTRDIKPGDLFFALKGEHFNGEDFLGEAYHIGAVPVTMQKNILGISVSDTSSALLALANFYKSRLIKLKHTVAITGSVGKTTTKEFLGILLSGRFKIHKTEGNLNNRIGLSLTILSAPAESEILILEMGMNHKGEISELSKCAKPDIAVITNIGTAHIGNLGSRENIAKAKLEIQDGMTGGSIIVPKEEKLLFNPPRSFTFSSVSSDADIYIIYNEGKIKISSKDEDVEAVFGLSEEQHISCLGAAVAAALKCGVNLAELKSRFSSISYKNTRQNIISVKNFYILSDFYNSSLESTLAALHRLVSVKGYGERSALLGDILELGDMAEDIHRRIGKECADLGLSRLYLFGKYAGSIKAEAIKYGMNKSRIFLNENTEFPGITADTIRCNHTENELILFKASRALRLERIIELLKI